MIELRTRLLAAMGLTPVLSAALVGCDVTPEPPVPLAALVDAEVAEPETQAPDVPEGTDPDTPIVDTEEPDPVLPPLSSYTPVLQSLAGATLVRNHQAMVGLSGYAPGVRVELWGSWRAIDQGRTTLYQDPDATLMATAETDPTGTAIFQFTVQNMPEAQTMMLQIDPVPTSTERLVIPVATVVPDHAGYLELGPGLPQAAVVPGTLWRACVPQYIYGTTCPTIADFHTWQGLEVTAFALGRTIPHTVASTACVEENAFADSCCYVMEFWDPAVSTIGDVCSVFDVVDPDTDVGDTDGGWIDTGWGGGFNPEYGRPFYTAGEVRLAPAVARSGWATEPGTLLTLDVDMRQRAVDLWVRAGLGEHASVAAFARFTLELMSLGAPAELVTRATLAQADEIRHATTCFGIASELAGEAMGPGRLPLDQALDRSDDVGHVVHGAVVEGCINETIAAVQARHAAEGAIGTIAAELTRIAEDESRHAELSWAFVHWVMAQHPEVRPVVERAFQTFDIGPQPAADPDEAVLASVGLLSERAMWRVASDVLAKVVGPCAQALLATDEVAHA